MIHRYNQTVSIEGDGPYIASVRRLLETVNGDGGMGQLLLSSLSMRYVGYRPIVLGPITRVGVVICPDDRNFEEAVPETEGDSLENRGRRSQGSSSTVYLTPGNFPPQPTGGSVRVADAALVHELMHALRHINGISNADRQMADGFETIDEFYSILI